MAGVDTKERILDSAEKLFSFNGIGGTSLRAITTDAGVNLAAVNYHFGTKEGLLERVYSRRLGPLNAERLRRLDRLEAEGKPVAVEPLVRAFLEPALGLLRVEGGAVFLRLLGRSLSEPEGPVRAIFLNQFREVSRRFGRAFATALPHLDPEEVMWRMFFMIGAMAHTLAAGDVLVSVSQGLCRADDPETHLRRLVAFAVAGFGAPAASSASEPAREEPS